MTGNNCVSRCLLPRPRYTTHLECSAVVAKGHGVLRGLVHIVLQHTKLCVEGVDQQRELWVGPQLGVLYTVATVLRFLALNTGGKHANLPHPLLDLQNNKRFCSVPWLLHPLFLQALTRHDVTIVPRRTLVS